MMVLKVVRDLSGDSALRKVLYTDPLSQMPENINALAREMIDEASKGKNLTSEQVQSIERDIYQMMSEGAVAQRNHEMEKTRQQLSKLGLLLSTFMKQKGMTYVQLQAKYEKEFTVDERRGHQSIIDSASRSNKSLYNKFADTLTKKFGFATSKL